MVASIPCLNILSARERPQRSVRSEYLDVRNKAAAACAAGHVAAGASEQKRQAWSYESVSASKFKASHRTTVTEPSTSSNPQGFLTCMLWFCGGYCSSAQANFSGINHTRSIDA